MTEREFELSHTKESLQSTPLPSSERGLCFKCHTQPKYGKTSPYCRACTHEYSRKYYAQNRARILDRQRQNLVLQRTRQRKRKRELVELKGGRCSRCGYDRNYSALVFHHHNGRQGGWKGGVGLLSSEDPQNGAFNINEVVLVCENCHKEIHHPELQVLKVQA